MATESPFVEIAKKVAEKILQPPLFVKRGAALLYQMTVDNQLSSKVNIKRPSRGSSAFQTDLCIFEKKSEEVSIPRVVMEFKTNISTHDVLIYNAKARKHKQVYPYLRYGIVASCATTIPGRLFIHNESLDFCATVSGLTGKRFHSFFADLLKDEVESSRRLEAIALGSVRRSRATLYS